MPYLATSLINDLTALPTAFILVLDDYHALELEAIHQLLSRLLDQLPRLLHLGLLSRTEPPLPLPRLRVGGQVSEIRATDLAFSETEAQTFLTHRLGRAPKPETVAALQERTEGWAAGLQLAALSLRGQADEGAFVQGFRGSNRYLLDYLLEEVLARQPQAIQDFLLQTAILDRLCAPLCEAVLSRGEEFPVGQFPARGASHSVSPLRGRSSSSTGELKTDELKTDELKTEPAAGQTMLAYLERANLFITPLDEEGRWYRYHFLFRELLRHTRQTHLTQEEVVALHRRAGAWLADNGLIEEALHHALATGDELSAAQWVEERRHELLNRQDFQTLARWLALLPEGAAQQRPALLLAKGWVTHFQHQPSAIFHLVGQAEACLESDRLALDEAARQTLRGEIDALRGAGWYWRGEARQLLTHLEWALPHIPVTHTFVRSQIMKGLGAAYQMTNQPAKATYILREVLEKSAAGDGLFQSELLDALSCIQFIAGDLTVCVQTLQELLYLSERKKFLLQITWAHYLLGAINYEWNELDAAAAHFSSVVEQVHPSVHLRGVHDSLLGLALVYQAQGQAEQAQERVASHLELLLEQKNDDLLNEVRSFQARLSLLQGEVETATRQLGRVNPNTPPGLMIAPEIPAFTQAKILLAQGSEASLGGRGRSCKNFGRRLIAQIISGA